MANDVTTVELNDGDVVIDDFGVIGLGSTPSDDTLAALDTIRFVGEGLDVGSLLIEEDGDDTILRFEGIDTVSVRLTDTRREEIDNLEAVGNIQFDGETSVSDSFDVVNASANLAQVWNPGTVTFLNDLSNETTGLDGSEDTIRGLGGDDILSGLSGADTLFGGAGNDSLFGDEGADILFVGDAFFPAAEPGQEDDPDFSDEADGGSDDDLLVDGLGASRFTGGEGEDVFVFQLGEAERDIYNFIEDFRFGEDRLLFLDQNGKIVSDPERLFDNVFYSTNPTNNAIFINLNPYGENESGERVVLLNEEGPDGQTTWETFISQSSVAFEGGGDITDGFFGIIEDSSELSAEQREALDLTEGVSDLQTNTVSGSTGTSEDDFDVTLALTTQEVSEDGSSTVRGYFSVEPTFDEPLPEDPVLFLTLQTGGTTARQLGPDEFDEIQPGLLTFEIEEGLPIGISDEPGSITAQGSFGDPGDPTNPVVLEVTNEIDLLLM